VLYCALTLTLYFFLSRTEILHRQRNDGIYPDKTFLILIDTIMKNGLFSPFFFCILFRRDNKLFYFIDDFHRRVSVAVVEYAV
jgi:hypothetical protein